MEDLILYYYDSCNMATNRIQELKAMATKTDDVDTLKDIEIRKNVLYAQVRHMKEIIGILKGYQREWASHEKS